MKITSTVVAAALTTSALIIPTMGASAETAGFSDPPDMTTSSTDVKWVEVTNERADDRFALKVRVNKIRLGSSMVVYLDRNRANAGPELRMVAVPDSEWALFRVGSWSDHGRRIDLCGRVRMSSFDNDHRATWRAERSCLGIGGAVRVAVKMIDPKGRADWAPAPKTFFDRVSAGR